MKKKTKRQTRSRAKKPLAKTQLKKISAGYSDQVLWDEYRTGRDSVRDGRTF
jgi:hypothetical protein